MTKYLLLRDNKESGPYSFDDLKAKGLKAYDLVWIEGKSAAWRYPSEVEELKAFAPAVEEQPFDRFYKRPSQSNNTATASAVQLKSASPVLSAEPSAVPGKRIIYVTMPAGRTTPASRESAPRETLKMPITIPAAPPAYSQKPDTAYSQIPDISYPQSAHAAYMPSSQSAQAPLPTESQTEAGLIHKDWNAGMATMPHTRTGRSKSAIMQLVAIALCVLALLAAGIFIGLSINKASLPQTIAAKKNPINPPPPIAHGAGNTPASSASPSLQQTINPDTVSRTAPLTQPTTTSSTPKKTQGAKDKSTVSSPKMTPTVLAKDSGLTGLPVIHREASHRIEQPVDKVDKDVIRDNLANLVSVASNSYSVGTFGGITGVQLTVSNKSVYPLDLVVVEVQYIQANKKVYKTENLYFRGIAPGSALMQEAPNSSRGIKVQYKITLVNSKELGLSYSAR